MKEKKIRIMDEADEKLSLMLEKFGYLSKEAKILVIMLSGKELVSKDIEEATGLRQPTVSLGTQHLVKMGILNSRKIKNDKKGRPMYKFNLSCTIDEFRKKIVQAAEDAIGEKKKELKEVTDLLKGF